MKTFRLAALLACMAHGQTTWKAERPFPTWKDLKSIVWAGDKYVAVGSQGAILLSSDGANWSRGQSPIDNPLTSVAWSGRQLVAVGDTGAILTSVNGLEWKSINSGTWKHFKKVIWGGSRFVVVGDARDNNPTHAIGAIYTSPEGNAWTLADTTDRPLTSVAWNGNRYVAVGYYGIRTSTDGAAWAQVQFKTSLTEPTVAAGIAVLDSGFILTTGTKTMFCSVNGTDWTESGSGHPRPIRTVHFAKNRFIAFGDSNLILTAVLTNVLKLPWQPPREDQPRAALRSVAWSGKEFLAVGDTGAVCSSTDGIRWSKMSSEGIPQFRQMIRGRDLFCGITSNRELFTSPDGLSWVRQTAPPIHDITWTGRRYYALTADSGVVVSQDAAAWQVVDHKFESASTLISSKGDTLVVIGYKTNRNICSFSIDGTAWKNSWMSSQSDLVVWHNKLTWTGNLFIGVGSHLSASKDGVAWNTTTDYSLSSMSPLTATGHGKQLVIFTSKGYIYLEGGKQYGTRGLQMLPGGIFPPIRSALWSGDRYFAVGDSGAILNSFDGEAWTRIKQDDKGTPDLEFVLQSGNRIYAFGKKGVVLSTDAPIASAVKPAAKSKRGPQRRALILGPRQAPSGEGDFLPTGRRIRLPAGE
jgi:photosystem II stability/assembly factor-like uncharacterized protein